MAKINAKNKTVKAVDTKPATVAKTIPAKAEVKETKGASVVAESAPKAAASTTKAATKTTAKATAKSTKATTKAATIKSSLTLEIGDAQITEKDLVAKIKKAWTSQFKGKVKDIKSIDIYVKPEDNKAYYVINKDANENYFVEL